MIYCKCGGIFRSTSRFGVVEDGVIQRRHYRCEKCGTPLTTSEVDVDEYKDMKKKVTELEIKLYMVKLYNHGEKPYLVRKGDKISQLVILPCLLPELEVVDSLEDTERGTGGFGSTGR